MPVAVYVLALRSDDSLPGGITLPESWQSRLKADRPSWRNQRSLRGYTLLAAAMKQLRPGEELPPLLCSPEGKPGFPGEVGWHFSLSHTQDLTVLALSQRQVGMDCEKLRAAPPHLKERFGSLSEEAFWRDWTAREAIGKLRGSGIAPLLRERPALLPGEQLHTITEVAGYALCVACLAGEPPRLYLAGNLPELKRSEERK